MTDITDSECWEAEERCDRYHRQRILGSIGEISEISQTENVGKQRRKMTGITDRE